MSTPSSNGTAAAPLARNDYREGQVLRARDLERESGYFLARYRQHAALAHSPGILFGLQVTAVKRATDEAVSPGELHEARQKNERVPLDLFVTSGAAVDGFGRLIIVPRREQLRTDLALEPSVLSSGTYRLELLYHRQVQGAGGLAGGCGAGAEGGGGAVVREGYRFRLMHPDEGSPAPPGSVLDGAPDAPEAEAPVVLGTLAWWSGSDPTGFIGYSDRDRAYAGVRAQQVRTPDGRVELLVHDPVSGFAVRFADLPALDADDPFTPGPFQDRFRVDPRGNAWTAGAVSIHPGGITLRSDPNTEPTAPWGASLWNADQGKPFEKYAKEYAAGQRELRIALERGGSRDGTQRVVVGYVEGTEFRPAVAVYDAHPAGQPQHAVVEVWGDLHVRGIAHLFGVQRIPDDGDKSDDLDKLLAQMAGPLGGALRAVLVTDDKYLKDLGTSLAGREEFIKAVMAHPGFVAKVAGALAEDATLIGALVTRLKGDQGLVAGLATALAGLESFRTQIVDLVVQHLTTHPETVRSLARALAPYLGEPAILPEMLKVLAAALRADPTHLRRMLDVVVRPVIHGNRTELDSAVAALAAVAGAWYDGLTPPPAPPNSPSSPANPQGQA